MKNKKKSIQIAGCNMYTTDSKPSNYYKHHFSQGFWNMFLKRYNNKIPRDIYRGLSKNSNITWDIVTNNFEYINNDPAQPKTEWNWVHLSSNPNITMDIILSNLFNLDNSKDNPKTQWSWIGISKNSNITWEQLKYFFEVIPSIDQDTKENMIESFLSHNPNINIKVINEILTIGQIHIEAPLDFELSENLGINFDIVNKNMNTMEWDWADLSKNTMEKGRERWMRIVECRIQALFVLQKLQVFDENIIKLIVSKI